MDEKEILDRVLDLSIEQWNRAFGGTSALDIADKIDLPNDAVMLLMEKLCEEGKGTINRNVELYVIKLSPASPKLEIPNKPTVTHVFFPDKQLLTEHFYSSHLVREKYPEFKNRLHKGAHQLAMVLFSDEVLARYFDHPELYEIDDSLAGGHILANSDAPENRYLYVRYGKRKLLNGRTAVTAIYKDLYVMSAEEQRHWHAYEINDYETAKSDPNFERFLARTYEGEFVDFPSPLKDISEALALVNKSVSNGCIFSRTENSHLRLPVENNQKALYDSCSELYKLIGTDSLDQDVMRSLLIDVLGINEKEMIHAKTGKAFSSMQLLGYIESKLGIESLLTSAIKSIGKYRIEADHKLTKAIADENNYVDIFLSLCEEFYKSCVYFAYAIRNVQNKK